MSNSFQEHVDLVDRVLGTFTAHGLKVKSNKCSFFAQEVEYLGHVVGTEGIRKPESFVRKVDEIPQPTTVRELRVLGPCQPTFSASLCQILA